MAQDVPVTILVVDGRMMQSGHVCHVFALCNIDQYVGSSEQCALVVAHTREVGHDLRQAAITFGLSALSSTHSSASPVLVIYNFLGRCKFFK